MEEQHEDAVGSLEPARIKIGISTYNDYKYLDNLLQSIAWYTFIDERYDLVVLDDGSEDHYREGACAVAQKYGAAFISHDKNYGIPTAWNHLVDSLGSSGEIIVLLNNDLLMPPQWLQVAVHFLDANKDNSKVGSCYWNPVNSVPFEAMNAWLPTLTHTTYTTQDLVSGEDRGFIESGPMEVRVGENQGLGRVMCPCGCCFAFRRSVWEEVGSFDERLTSFHEESDWGTRCASLGRASFGFAYPRPYHTHGAAFAANPELDSGNRMAASRALYRETWQVPPDVTDYFKHVNDRLMSVIPYTMLKYLRPMYPPNPPVEYQRPGGEVFVAPALQEFEESF